MTRPQWMTSCPTCRELVAAFDAAAADDGPGEALAEWEQARAHVVHEHLADLPDYDPECANCLEWKATSGDPAGALPPHMLPVLGREDLLHRAGHAILPRDTLGAEQP